MAEVTSTVLKVIICIRLVYINSRNGNHLKISEDIRLLWIKIVLNYQKWIIYSKKELKNGLKIKISVVCNQEKHKKLVFIKKSLS